MRQRVMIAMALALEPVLLIADEPTTALDVTVQAEILELVKNLAAGENRGVLLITHDFGVVAEVADSVAVMYAGSIVESGSATAIFDSPAHPYTKALLSCVLVNVKAGESLTGDDSLIKDEFTSIDGEVPSPFEPVAGCPFHPRCAFSVRRCEEEFPLSRDFAPVKDPVSFKDDCRVKDDSRNGSATHSVRCHRAGEF
jgi:oligopeptide transport system ATP-binding protein